MEEQPGTINGEARRGAIGHRRIPPWLNIAYTLFLAVLAPVYWVHYGPANYLWFCDIALVLTLVALWAEWSLPASMAALGLLPEIHWIADFLCRLIFGHHIGGASTYMFMSSIPLYVRGLSLFHLFLPVLLVWTIWRLGYDRRALVVQTLLAWLVLTASYVVTTPQANLNWILGPGKPQTIVHPHLYFAMMLLFVPVVLYLPMHLLYRRSFPCPHLRKDPPCDAPSPS